MNNDKAHIEDFSPYLDLDVSDPRHAEIEDHIGGCPACSEEARRWQAVDASFHTPEAEIEVPPFQWQRIAAELRNPAPAGVVSRLLALRRPWGLAWNVTLATLILGTFLISGLQYRRYSEERRILYAITSYTAEKGERMGSAGNPFEIAAAVTGNNPFARKAPFGAPTDRR